MSPFMGRLDDIGESGLNLVADIAYIFKEYGYNTQIIAASIRHIGHLEEAALAGAHIATIPGTLFEKLWSHPLTDAGIESFKKDWEAFENR